MGMSRLALVGKQEKIQHYKILLLIELSFVILLPENIKNGYWLVLALYFIAVRQKENINQKSKNHEIRIIYRSTDGGLMLFRTRQGSTL